MTRKVDKSVSISGGRMNSERGVSNVNIDEGAGREVFADKFGE